jgi:hypothetical protein
MDLDILEREKKTPTTTTTNNFKVVIFLKFHEQLLNYIA